MSVIWEGEELKINKMRKKRKIKEEFKEKSKKWNQEDYGNHYAD